jgi:hypothetical protein
MGYALDIHRLPLRQRVISYRRHMIIDLQPK